MSYPRKRGAHYSPKFRAKLVHFILDDGQDAVTVAREWGVNHGTLGSWVVRERKARREAELAESAETAPDVDFDQLEHLQIVNANLQVQVKDLQGRVQELTALVQKYEQMANRIFDLLEDVM